MSITFTIASSSNHFRPWDIVKASGVGKAMVVRIGQGNALTLIPYKRSKYRIVHFFKFGWIKVKWSIKNYLYNFKNKY